MKQYAPNILQVVLFAAVLAWAAGCAESVAPRVPYEDDLSVYGLLTPDLDTQSVWVFPIEEFPTLGTPDALEDVTVSSTDLETGKTRVWQDTVVTRDNGQHEYLYRSPFRAAFDHSYRIEARRGGEEEPAWAEVRIPPQATVQLVSATPDTLTVHVIAESAEALRAEVEYHVRMPNLPDTSYMMPYWGTEEKISGGWRFKIRFRIDKSWVEQWYVADMNTFSPNCPTSAGLLLGELRLHVLVGDTTWAPPGPAFDPYILSQPGTMQNVHNGEGFIGGGYRVDAPLDVPRSVVNAVCLIYCRTPSFRGCDI